jgi:hypothetical protein
VETQLASNHARSVRDLSRERARAPFTTGQTVTDPLTRVQYGMQEEGGRPAIWISNGQVRVTQKLDFEFGSGKHAYGYLAMLDRSSWLDTRLNYYSLLHAWDFTSGQDVAAAHLRTQPLGRPLPEGEAARCFLCHSTVVRASGVGKAPLDGSQLRVRPQRSDLGVTCESCHGPRAAHVRERRAGLPVSHPPRLSADAMNEVCGKCHGFTGTNPSHPVIARFQPYGLSQSRCFRASAGRLSCVSCHDPHANARSDTAFYEAKCISCHPGPKEAREPKEADGAAVRTVCPVNRVRGCIGCHMRIDSKTMLHMTFADHNIRVLPRAQQQPGFRTEALSPRE